MLRKFFLNLLLLISVSTAPLLSKESCSNCLGSGFLVGAYGTFHVFEFHTKDNVFALPTVQSELWEYDAFQRAPGGGSFIGWGVPFCERLNLAFKAAVTGYASEAQYSYFDFNPTLSFPNKMRVRYVVDLSLEPGVRIGNCLLLSVKFGPSYVGWRQVRQIIDNTLPLPVLDEDEQYFRNWGYEFGATANISITRGTSAFIEFDGHSYPINNSKRRIVENVSGFNDFLEYRVTHLYGFGFRFGLMAQF
ncbi:MAG: hypothetical protein WAM28_05185 [Chlamydiales bacterium]